MQIRTETAEDHALIHSLHLAAFNEPDGEPAPEAGLVDELRADGDSLADLCLVAMDGEVLGHVMCSRGWLADSPAVGLGPIGVLPDHQGRGVGSALMEEVIGLADENGEPAIVLLGEPAYYSRFGFRAASELGIEPPEGWGDYFQALPLASWKPGLRGRFTYAPAFGRL